MSSAASSRVPDEETFLADADQRAEIIDFVRALQDRQRKVAAFEPGLVGPDGEKIPLPEPLYRALVQAAEALAQGFGVTVAPQHMKLSTYQAAEFLGISRPTLIRLLESDEIPFERSSDRPGAHRRVRLSDLLAYQARRQHRREELLGSILGDAVEFGEYDAPPVDP